MKKKFVALLLSGVMLIGSCFSLDCFAAPHHKNKPAVHKVSRPDTSVKPKKVKKHHVKKKPSEKKWFCSHKNKPGVKKHETKKFKWFKKDKKQTVKKHETKKFKWFKKKKKQTVKSQQKRQRKFFKFWRKRH